MKLSSFFGKSKKVEVQAPLAGKWVALNAVPDPTFAEKVLGDGFAIDPSEGVVVAPFDATVVNMFRTGHAIGLEGPQGVEILIHVGIDTVKMKGEGFEALVKNGDQVKAGQPLIRFNLGLVREKAASTVSPVVFTAMEKIAKIDFLGNNEVRAGQGAATLELN